MHLIYVCFFPLCFLVTNVPGIENAMVVHDDGEVTSLHPVVDTIGFVANLRALIAYSDDISIFIILFSLVDIVDDRGKMLTVSMAQHFVIANKIGKVIFVALISRNSKAMLQNGGIAVQPITMVNDLLKKCMIIFLIFLVYTIIGSLQG